MPANASYVRKIDVRLTADLIKETQFYPARNLGEDREIDASFPQSSS